MAATVLSPAGLAAQAGPAERPITLGQAVAEALDRNGDLEAARAGTDAARAGAREASAFLFPAVAVDAGAVRSDDPVAVFGTRLRQERFRESDFAVDALNRPDPLSDWTAGAGVTWRVADPAAWSGRAAADLAAEARELSLDRRRDAVGFRTRVLYLEALAGGARTGAADTALTAARATLEVIRRRRDQGMLTEADVLQARAEVAGAEAALADARRRHLDARTRLGVHMGWSPDTLPRPVDDLLSRDPEGTPAAGAEVRSRDALRALERRARAADARVSQAVRSRLPALEAFGGVSTHAATLDGDRTANWTAGARLRWPLFTGFAREGAVDRARAGERAARATYRQRLLEARAELAEARRGVDAARRVAEAAASAASAAAEARRLVRRRLEEGMATTADLLRADARAAETRLDAIRARTDLHAAAARLDFVRGADLIHDTTDTRE